MNKTLITYTLCLITQDSNVSWMFDSADGTVSMMSAPPCIRELRPARASPRPG